MQIGSVLRRPFEHRVKPKIAGSSRRLQRLLLICGVLAAVLSYATDIVAGATRTGYSFASQSASVLSSPGAPSRPLVLQLDLVADILVIAFALGVWLSAGQRRSLRVMAGVLAASAVLQSIAVTFFPFHPGQATGDFANIMNVALMAPSIVGWFLAIGLGAVAFRHGFRFFSIGLLVALFVEDLLVTAGASLFVEGGHPGSLVGIQERTMIYGFYAWLALLAVVQVRAGLTDCVTDFQAYGTMYGVRRTTIYLPESLKRTLARAAHEEGRTEADLIREGLERLLESRHAKPKLPLFKSGKPDLAENVDRDLDGFGER